jgi:hypothetical protein
MNVSTLTLLLQIAALLHLGLLWAGASMPRAVHLSTHLAKLPPFLRRLFLVYFVFIGLCLVAFGTLTFFFASSMAEGEPIARALCVFFTIFWTVRLLAAHLIFDCKPYLTNRFRKAGFHALNLVFLYLPLVYFVAALKGGGR